MPCDSIQQSTVKLEFRAENKEFLVAALKTRGYQVRETAENITFTNRYGSLRGSFANGEVRVTGRQEEVDRFDVDAIKRAYSVEVLKEAADQFGWEVNRVGEFEFEVQREGF